MATGILVMSGIMVCLEYERYNGMLGIKVSYKLSVY